MVAPAPEKAPQERRPTQRRATQDLPLRLPPTVARAASVRPAKEAPNVAESRPRVGETSQKIRTAQDPRKRTGRPSGLHCQPRRPRLTLPPPTTRQHLRSADIRGPHRAATRHPHRAATRHPHRAATRHPHRAATRHPHRAATRHPRRAATRHPRQAATPPATGRLSRPARRLSRPPGIPRPADTTSPRTGCRRTARAMGRLLLNPLRTHGRAPRATEGLNTGTKAPGPLPGTAPESWRTSSTG